VKVRIVSQYDPTLIPTEAVRKQLLFLSRAMTREGIDLEFDVITDPTPGVGRTWGVPRDVVVLHRPPFRSAISLLSSDLDLLVLHTTMGWTAFPVMEALRVRWMPHIACVYNSMLYHFWEKRLFGVPLSHWYSHIQNIGIYCRWQERLLAQVLPQARTHLLVPIVDDYPGRRKPTEYPSLLYVGSFDKKRGADFLLRAAQRLEKESPDVVIHMAIRTSIGQELAKRQVSEMGLSNVRISGNVDIWEALSKAWVFVYPFQGSSPPSVPLSIIEALKSHTPIVAVSKGGIPEVLPPKSLFDGSLQDFLYRIRQQLENPTVAPCPDRFLFENAVRRYIKTCRRIEQEEPK